MKKKGQAVTFTNAPTIILLLVVVVLVAAAGATALSSMKQAQCTNYWEGSTCYNNASKNYEVASTHAYNATAGGEQGLANFSIQIPTIGTMVGVGLILAVVIGVFAYFARRQD